MNRHLIAYLALLVTSFSSGYCGVIYATDVTLRVDYANPGHSISPRLVGIFFEDINFAADGGLSADLVKNGSFEVPGPLLGWHEIDDSVVVSKQTEAPLKAANPSYLRLEAKATEPTGGVVNNGYRGMGVRAGESYDFSAFARTVAGQKVKLAIRLVGKGDEVLAEKQLEVSGSQWEEATAELEVNETQPKAHLEILLISSGVADIDLVSVFPRDTWKGRKPGLRKDLVEKLAALKPAFFRFPGGCIVEGSQLKYRYQWKTTIGPPDERRLVFNRWNTEFQHRLTPDYYQSFQLGFFEYFQLAEDIGAEPLPIINCGMACQFNTGELVPLEKLEPYIQDALDLVEFANGPADSKWGAERAAMGHPEPFNLRLLGVGNEQWGPEYFERYERFAKVLQEKHPEIELISTSGPFPAGRHFDFAWPRLRKLQVPIVDEHCYAVPDWFLRSATRYDDYSRKGPKVFMGEYAAQSDQIVSVHNRNNLRCALAEAAFLTGIERNSDVVTMSAYAPLFAHEEAWQWRPNLIWFDNLSSYGTPNYYVQQLFSLNRGDKILPLELVDERGPLEYRGRIGVGTYNSSAEFRNIRVTAGEQTLLQPESLADDQLTRRGGDWQVDGTFLRQSSARGNARVMFGSSDWRNYDITLEAQKTSGAEGFAIFFRAGPGGSRIEWNLGGWDNREHGLISHLATHVETPNLLERKDGTIERNRWYKIRVQLRDDRIRCYLDDQLIHDMEVPEPEIARLYACASLDEESGEAILKVVNPLDEPTSATVKIDGARNLGKSASVIVLTGNNPEAENSIAQPENVAPKELTWQGVSSEFQYEFPANSLTVMRLPRD